MPPTKQQFEAMHAKQQEDFKRIRALDLSLLHSAAVKAEQLTGSDGWDAFLRQLQARLEQAGQTRQMWDERMRLAFSDTDLRMAQANWHIWNSRVDTLNEVMELPKHVMETAHKELKPS